MITNSMPVCMTMNMPTHCDVFNHFLLYYIFHVITVSHDNLFLIAFQRKQPGQELFV